MRIMGIDPGLHATGYGFVESSARTLRVVAAGDIRPPRQGPISTRLGVIRDELSALIARYRPAAAVLEQIFTHHAHVTTAALIGHARGAACLAIHDHSLPLAEYLPTQVKKSLTGRGHATKDQMLRMVVVRLGAQDAAWSSDAADALALAIVHAHTASQRGRLPAGVSR
jgi:crossover junction endodeoxyribonuclease RuvC